MSFIIFFSKLVTLGPAAKNFFLIFLFMPKTLFNFSIFTELSFGKYPTFFMLVGFTLGLLFLQN
tara:strand:+ start:699 stop:890 length:192 start_codon:yes stop_codon:yes gene_type:complete